MLGVAFGILDFTEWMGGTQMRHLLFSLERVGSDPTLNMSTTSPLVLQGRTEGALQLWKVLC